MRSAFASPVDVHARKRSRMPPEPLKPDALVEGQGVRHAGWATLKSGRRERAIARRPYSRRGFTSPPTHASACRMPVPW
eukprot:869715-Prymnesium_polylepis.1